MLPDIIVEGQLIYSKQFVDGKCKFYFQFIILFTRVVSHNVYVIYPGEFLYYCFFMKMKIHIRNHFDSVHMARSDQSFQIMLTIVVYVKGMTIPTLLL